MQSNQAATAVIPNDAVEVKRDGLTYGADLEAVLAATQERQQRLEAAEVPESLRILAANIRQESKLIGLKGKPSLDKGELFDAYGHDVNILNDRMSDLESCVRHAIRCSIVFGGSRDLNPEQKEQRAQEVWRKLQSKIPAVEYANVLRLPHTLAAKESAVILTELTTQFEQAMADALYRLALQMVALTEENLVGLVQWSSEDTCCYHYFVHEHREDVESEKSETTESGRARTTKKTRGVRKAQYQTRHVHHLVNARLHNLEAYAEPMPERVKRFVESVPPRVRHLFQIVDGQMTLEEVISRKVGEHTDVEVESTTVYLRDPAVTLGDYALVGWKPDEVEHDIAEKRKERAKLWGEVVRGILVVMVIIAALGAIGAGVWFVGWKLPANQAAEQEQERLDALAAAQRSRDTYTTFVDSARQNGALAKARAEEKLELGDEVRVFYAGLSQSWQPGIELRVGNMEGRAIHFALTPIPDTNASMCYGDVELIDELGLPFKLQVTRADVISLEYSVTSSTATAEQK